MSKFEYFETIFKHLHLTWNKGKATKRIFYLLFFIQNLFRDDWIWFEVKIVFQRYPIF